MNKKMVKKVLKLVGVLLLDILLAAAILGAFSYSIFLVPQVVEPEAVLPTLTEEYTFELPFDSLFPFTEDIFGDDTPNETKTPQGDQTPDTTPTVTPDNTSNGDNKTEEPSVTPTPTPIDLGCNVNGELTSFATSVIASKKYENSSFDRTLTMIADDYSNGSRILINKVEIGSGSDKITYFVVDAYVSKISNISTNVSINSDNQLTTDYVADQAAEVGAKLAISGDSFSFTSGGYIIRNGVRYRNKSTTRDYCLLYLDGTMKCVDGKTFESNKSAYTKNLWQSWAFGPTLFDENGKPKTSNSQYSMTGILEKHPRSAIGCVSPGHYVFILVDGRSEGYSCGVTMLELSQIMYE